MSDIMFTGRPGMVELADFMGDDASIVRAARVSTVGYSSDPSPEAPNSNSQLINYLMRNRHGSPFEHNSMTFRIKAPIFVWREFMRHRIGFSYNEESARYRELDPVFYVPTYSRTQTGKPGHYQFGLGDNDQDDVVRKSIKYVSRQAYAQYRAMLEEGIAREMARMVLPVNIFSTAYVTCNARSLMSFLSLRNAQPHSTYPTNPQEEIQGVARQMEVRFKDLFPLTHAAFDSYGRVAP